LSSRRPARHSPAIRGYGVFRPRSARLHSRAQWLAIQSPSLGDRRFLASPSASLSLLHSVALILPSDLEAQSGVPQGQSGDNRSRRIIGGHRRS
jgi:hypothetical protein